MKPHIDPILKVI